MGSETSHTPGPWAVERVDHEDGLFVYEIRTEDHAGHLLLAEVREADREGDDITCEACKGLGFIDHGQTDEEDAEACIPCGGEGWVFRGAIGSAKADAELIASAPMLLAELARLKADPALSAPSVPHGAHTEDRRELASEYQSLIERLEGLAQKWEADANRSEGLAEIEEHVDEEWYLRGRVDARRGAAKEIRSLLSSLRESLNTPGLASNEEDGE